jgi:NADPH:quinone reductase-like Zn-dependent oxidoreductase
MLKGMVEYEFPVTLGRDYAGTVEQVGEGVTSFAPGDEVFGFVLHANPNVRDGSWADLIAVSEQSVAAKPAGVETSVAGATPLAGITALRCVDPLDLSSGESVLIVGATGGVGSIAVQLAAQAGANVVATGLDEDHQYLQGLGAAELIDRDGDVAAAARASHPDGVDALIDLVSHSPEGFDAYAVALKPGGRASSPLRGIGEGSRRFPVMATPDPADLDRLAQLLDAGTLRVPLQSRYPLERAADALAALPATHTQGKLAISVD